MRNDLEVEVTVSVGVEDRDESKSTEDADDVAADRGFGALWSSSSTRQRVSNDGG